MCQVCHIHWCPFCAGALWHPLWSWGSSRLLLTSCKLWQRTKSRWESHIYFEAWGFHCLVIKKIRHSIWYLQCPANGSMTVGRDGLCLEDLMIGLSILSAHFHLMANLIFQFCKLLRYSCKVYFKIYYCILSRNTAYLFHFEFFFTNFYTNNGI